MTTVTLESPPSASRLEELVDKLWTLFQDEPAQEVLASNLVRAIHEARRLRQAGDLAAALAVFNGVDITEASDAQLRWLYAEWLDIARRRFAGDDAMLYSPASGKAAALVPAGSDDTTLQVTAVLGMRWPVGKLVSRRSLRGLKPLPNTKKGGVTWS